MANLKRKLARLSNFPGGAGAVPVAAACAVAPVDDNPRLELLRRRLQNMRPLRHTAPAATAPPVPLPGSELQTPWGPVHLAHERHPGFLCHGTVPLDACLKGTGAHLALLALDPSLGTVNVSRLLFFDTETTGLAGGAGTVPFLIGLGWFEDGHWHQEQMLLRRPGDEEPILRRVAARLAQASALVTYNGKSFDWPLLKARFVLSRLPPPAALPHLDLLHSARRLLRRRQAGLRLVHVEQHLLGFTRVGDMDGAQIPPTYFAFLRGAPAHTLTPILVHNAHDVRALAAMLGALLRHLESPESAAHAGDRLAVAELNWRAGAMTQALDFVASVTTVTHCSASVALHCEAHLLAGRVHHRQKDWPAAAAAFRAALAARDADPLRCARAHLELAKLYEHRLGDLSRALQHGAHTAAIEGPAAQAKRLARLQRRAQDRPI